jgi:hypothetical protein
MARAGDNVAARCLEPDGRAQQQPLARHAPES